jgi:hypothetical protein
MIEFELNDDDVVHMDPGQSMLSTPTFKVEQLKERFRSYKNHLHPAIEEWVGEGIRCEILRSGKGWQKGKVRLQVQFIPNEPDEPSSLNQSSLRPSPNPQP